jgi:hypothetical protein
MYEMKSGLKVNYPNLIKDSAKFVEDTLTLIKNMENDPEVIPDILSIIKAITSVISAPNPGNIIPMIITVETLVKAIGNDQSIKSEVFVVVADINAVKADLGL